MGSVVMRYVKMMIDMIFDILLCVDCLLFIMDFFKVFSFRKW